MKAIPQARRVRVLLTSVVAALLSPAAFAVDVRFCTDFGAVDVTIDERAAPLHAANFLGYVDAGFYDGTVFHRVVPGSMVQGGRFGLSLEERAPNAPVTNESDNGLANRRGTIAAARSDDPNSATSQFFINLADNPHLDAAADTPGYTVFGQVTAGLDTIDAIAELPRDTVGGLQDVPVPIVQVQSIVTLDRSPVFGLSIEPDPAELSANFDRARAREDAAATLAALDAMKQSCVELDPAQIIAGAEAAIALRQLDRAEYMLEPILATASALDPQRQAAERLLRGRPVTVEQSRDVDQLIGHCRQPVAPSVPNGRFAEQAALQALESNVLRFRQSSELYLTCVSQFLERNELDATEIVAVTDRYNEMVIELTAVSMRFNQAVRNLQPVQQPGFDSN